MSLGWRFYYLSLLKDKTWVSRERRISFLPDPVSSAAPCEGFCSSDHLIHRSPDHPIALPSPVHPNI